MSWYNPDLSILTKGQRSYVAFIEESFNMRSPSGDPIPYRMTDYQKEFHASSINVLREAADDILFDKARGISFTFSSLIEMIVTAATYDNQTIPIFQQRKENSIATIATCRWLIENSNLEDLKVAVEYNKMSIHFKHTNSTIVAFPSASGNAAHAIRSIRLIRALVDEFAFQTNGKELWDALQECAQGDLSQFLIGSTPKGKQNQYQTLVDQAKSGEYGFRYFHLPVFDPTKFNPKIPIPKQEGLTPIAPWISMKKLELKRKRDWRVFMQENMCFLKNTLVISKNPKTIDHITVGDIVYDKDGKLVEVLDVYKRRYAGDILSITVWNGDTVECTPEHPFYAIQNTKSRPNYYSIEDASFIPAESLNCNDILLYPKIDYMNFDSSKMLDFGTHYGLRIRDIDTFNYDGHVYNLHTSNSNTYVVNNSAVHNCDPLDDHLSLFPQSKIYARINEELINYKSKLYLNFVYETTNPIVVGIDFAEYVDLFSISAFELIPDEKGRVVWVQRYLDYFNGVETPELREYTNKVLDMFPTAIKCRIDRTGPGSGYYTLMKREKPQIMEGISFGSSINVLGKREKQKVRQYMIMNMKNMIEETEYEMVQFLPDDTQVLHMNSMNRQMEIDRELAKTGHGDILFANALALMPLSHFAKKMATNHTKTIGPRTTPAERSNAQVGETLKDKLRRYKKIGSYKY